VFTPSGPLAPHTTYTVALGPVVRRAGSARQVAPGRTWTFTTGGPTTSAQNQISFLSARGGIRNVWLMNPDGSNPRQITTELAPVGEYDVTSDGRTIVYESAGVVTRMGLDGSDPTRVTAPGSHEYAPVLSPDGTEVLLGRRDASGADLGYWLVPLSSAAPGTRERQVTSDGAPQLGSSTIAGDGLIGGAGVPVWSRRAAFDPTGRWLLLVDALGRVLRVDLASPVPSSVPEDLGLSAPLGPPAWGPAQGAFLVVARGAAGSGVMRIPTASPFSFVFPAAGPVAVAADGGIATLVAPGGAHIGYSSLAATSPESLTSATDLADRSPAFSPGGTTLLFGRVLVAAPDRSAGIWLSGLDGRDLRQLSTDGADARWLP
jgi:Tol biopolymer transport system component